MLVSNVFATTSFLLAIYIQPMVGQTEDLIMPKGNARTAFIDMQSNNQHFKDFPKKVVKRNALRNRAKIWDGAIVPYVLDTTSFSEFQVWNIQKAFEEFHDKTCVRFKKRTKEDKYVYITRALGTCSSPMGAPSFAGIAHLYLSNACLQRGTVIHELMHTIGFYHEHNRPDRDNYVQIDWDNIPKEKQHNFFKESETSVDTLQEPYDYGSIMHYSAYSFALDWNKPTINIVGHRQLPILIGQRTGLSKLDVAKVNILYECNKDTLHASDSIIFPTNFQQYVPLPFRYNWDLSETYIQKQH